jgi:hypothetical protein
MDLTYMYRIFHLNATECTFSAAYENFPEVDYNQDIK